MKISFIIPLYEVRRVDLHRCLDSVFSQSIPGNEYEVICVDDCSPSQKTSIFTQQYEYQEITPPQLSLIRHTENKRQGGARNTAIKVAKGDYIFFIDQDDWLIDGCVAKMLNAIRDFPNYDLIMFDSAIGNENGDVVSTGHYTAVNKTGTMTGTDFLCAQEVPWTPWHYMYRRKFLIDNNYRFEEKVRFEDKDFVMRCTANARKMVFLPETAIVHTVSDNEQSAIGNDKYKIIDILKIAYRTGQVAREEYAKGNNKAGDAIMGHQDFSYKSLMKKFLWRLQLCDLTTVLKAYPPTTNQKSPTLLQLTANHPVVISLLLWMASPLMYTIYYLYKALRK